MLHYFLLYSIMPISIFVNKTLYQRIKSEEHREKGKIVQIIIQTFSLIQCVCYPSILFFTGLLDFSLNYIKLLELANARYLITSIAFSLSFLRTYLAFHSLIIATVRFTFIVFDSSAEKFGVQRIRKLSIVLSIVIPLVTAVLYDITTPIEDKMSIFDIFYGSSISSNETNQTFDNTSRGINLAIQSPIYIFANTFFPRSIVYTMNIIGMILFVIIYSNLIEAVLYGYIMTTYKRYYYRLITKLRKLEII